jgi:hypothetical protein
MPVDLAAGPLPRPGFLHVDDVCGWKIKTYGVAAGSRPRAELVAAARRVTTGTLPERPDLDGSFGLGFLIVHDATGSCRALVHWWARPDELHQRVFVTSSDHPRSLALLSIAPIGRIPELLVIEHERQAWLRHMLDCPGGPDLDAYLADVLG